MSIQTPLPDGRLEDGLTINLYETTANQESLEKRTSLRVDYVLTPSYTNLIILEPTGCGVEEKRLLEKTRSAMQHFLTKSQDDLFANFARSIQRLGYEEVYR